jgi:hypothetical protein
MFLVFERALRTQYTEYEIFPKGDFPNNGQQGHYLVRLGKLSKVVCIDYKFPKSGVQGRQINTRVSDGDILRGVAALKVLFL